MQQHQQQSQVHSQPQHQTPAAAPSQNPSCTPNTAASSRRHSWPQAHWQQLLELELSSPSSPEAEADLLLQQQQQHQQLEPYTQDGFPPSSCNSAPGSPHSINSNHHQQLEDSSRKPCFSFGSAAAAKRTLPYITPLKLRMAGSSSDGSTAAATSPTAGNPLSPDGLIVN